MDKKSIHDGWFVEVDSTGKSQSMMTKELKEGANGTTITSHPDNAGKGRAIRTQLSLDALLLH